MPWLSLNTLEVLKNLLANIGFSMFNNFIINPLEIFNNHLWIICHVHFFISIIATSKIFLYLLLFYVSLIFSFSFAITYYIFYQYMNDYYDHILSSSILYIIYYKFNNTIFITFFFTLFYFLICKF